MYRPDKVTISYDLHYKKWLRTELFTDNDGILHKVRKWYATKDEADTGN